MYIGIYIQLYMESDMYIDFYVFNYVYIYTQIMHLQSGPPLLDLSHLLEVLRPSLPLGSQASRSELPGGFPKNLSVTIRL